MSVHVVSASAGTGKTYRIAQEVTRALLTEEARPEGVVGITYTTKAAADLESRIRTDLIRVGRTDLAARVRDGYLGTVHAICQRLLREFAFQAGHSPLLEPIEESQRERLFAEGLAGALAGREERIGRIAERFQLENWEKGPLRAIVDRARENGLDGPGVRDAGERSLASLLAVLPPVATGDEAYRTRLADEARAADDALRQLNRAGNAAAKRRDAVHDLVHGLGRSPGLPPWTLQLKAARQEWTREEQPAVAVLQSVVASHLACASLRTDLEELTRGVFGVAADALEAYAQAKETARVVDFQDMLALAAGLLRERDVAAALQRKLDLVVVDEFQDTSPMQLAVVSALASIARRSVWVGDRKQAIFGFQGSDPVLMEAAIGQALGDRPPEFLSESWRSRPALVAFTSELFTRVLASHGFSEREVRISTPASRPDPAEMGGMPVLECWWWEGSEPEGIADGLSRLFADAPLVRDKDSGAVRPLVPRDVAVLARRNDDCRKIAAALAARRIPATLEAAGLAHTPEAIVVRSALALVADPLDGIAAMNVSYLAGRGAADPDGWLSGRLLEAVDNAEARERAATAGETLPERRLPFADDPRVEALRTLHGNSTQFAPTEALDMAIAAAGIMELLRTWPNPAQRFANVEALRDAARSYEELCRVRRSAGTLAGLVDHLATLADQKEADLQGVPATENAVFLSTWHSAKGLEWPVTVVGSLGFAKDRSPWEVWAEPAQSFDPAFPLAGRWVRWWPWPYGKLSAGIDLVPLVATTSEVQRLRQSDARERARLLYVAFTRARDRLVLAAAIKRGRPQLDALQPLCDATGQAAVVFPFGAPDGTETVRVGDLELACRVRAVSGMEVEQAAVEGTPRPWYDDAPRVERAAEIATPSSEAIGQAEPGCVGRVWGLAGRMVLNGATDMASLGDAVHAFLAADSTTGDREGMATRLLSAYGVAGAVAPASLVQASDALRSFLEASYPRAAWRREWPLLARFIDGGQSRILQGQVDLFLEWPEGFVLVDHKSFPGSEHERDARIIAHAAQLGAYAFFLERALHKPLRAALVHLPIRGEIVEVDVAAVVHEWGKRTAG